MKKYKDLTPLQTIHKIRSTLFELGILLKEHQFIHNDFYSCRINIANDGLSSLDLGANGKGSTPEYSLASGYAEFMERIQNKMLFTNMKYATEKFLKTLPSDSEFVSKLRANDLVLNYLFDKNEEYWRTENVVEYCGEELLLLLNFQDKAKLLQFIKEELRYEELIMIPFYSVSKEKTVFLPVELLLSTTGSNGMAAGNSFKEAFLQGLCEIFERHAISEIYFKKIVPPTLPLEYFAGTDIYRKIKNLILHNGYEIIIKDCSLNKGLPVIGALIIDRKRQMYNFKLGSDFVSSRALERCFTEFHQSASDFHGLPIHLSIFRDPENVDRFNYHNFVKIIANGMGYWPYSIFSDNFSYPFKGFDPEYGIADEQDIKNSIELIRNMGYDLYIRDNSMFGFSTYYSVVPGLSQVSKNQLDIKQFKKSFKDIHLMNKLGDLTKEEARLLAFTIDDNYELLQFYHFNYCQTYIYNTHPDLANLNMELVQFMLYYYIGDVGNARKYLGLFLQDKERNIYTYYFAVYEYLSLLFVNQEDKSTVRSVLEKCYGKEIATEVEEDLKEPDAIFRYYDFPTCFECEKCTIQPTCSFFKAIQLEKNINTYGENHYMDQADLKEKLDKILLD